MSNWEKNLRKITPYVPGEQPKNSNIIKLNANENPYPPSPEVINALKNFDAEHLRMYPNSYSLKLKSAIAKHFKLNFSKNFMKYFMQKKPVAKEAIHPSAIALKLNVWISAGLISKIG